MWWREALRFNLKYVCRQGGLDASFFVSFAGLLYFLYSFRNVSENLSFVCKQQALLLALLLVLLYFDYLRVRIFDYLDPSCFLAFPVARYKLFFLTLLYDLLNLKLAGILTFLAFFPSFMSGYRDAGFTLELFLFLVPVSVIVSLLARRYSQAAILYRILYATSVMILFIILLFVGLSPGSFQDILWILPWADMFLIVISFLFLLYGIAGFIFLKLLSYKPLYDFRKSDRYNKSWKGF